MNSFEIDTKNFVLKHLGYNRTTKRWDCQMFDTAFRLTVSGNSPQEAIDLWVHARNNYTARVLAYENEKKRLEQEAKAAEEEFNRAMNNIELFVERALEGYKKCQG